MRYIKLNLLLLCALTLYACDRSMETSSPDGRLRLTPSENEMVLGIRGDDGSFRTLMTLDVKALSRGKVSRHKADYTMVSGKASRCTNAYTQTEYSLEDGRVLKLRVYNDGFCWSGLHDYKVDFSASKSNWLQRWTEAYEHFFPKDADYPEDARIAYPALFEYEDGIFALLSESDVNRTNAATSMYRGELPLSFELRPDGEQDGGWQTLIAGSLADIVESTLITDNSPQTAYEDLSWIEPGVASWVYWAYNHGSKEYEIVKKYIDFAAKLKLPYVLIDAEWDEMPLIEANQGKTVEDAIAYAVSLGVKPIIWYSSSIGWVNGAPGPKYRLNTPEDREKEFAWCENLGVKGVKIDFFSGDTNENLDFMIELLECAARHHLLVNFHGATTMRGWQRTYPNLISTEAVYGAEWYNNLPFLTNRAAAHNATLPFTRNVLGSMDYTPCAFSDSQHPHITTHAHELALTALFESGIQHLADRPESFLAQPQQVLDYLSALPAAWDETRYVSGYPGRSAVLARRSGSKWYIAGINGLDEAQTLDLGRVQSLLDKPSEITLYADSASENNPWTIASLPELPTSIACLPRGGFVITLNAQ